MSTPSTFPMLIVGIIIALSLSACSATHTALNARELTVQTTMSNTIFTDPPEVERPLRVYLKVKNTSASPELSIHEQVEDALIAQGYQVRRSAKNTDFTLQVNVLSVEKTTKGKHDRTKYGKYGDPIGGAVLGGGMGYALGSGPGGIIGGVVGATLGVVADALVDNIVFVTITDVRLGQTIAGDASVEMSSTSKRGKNATVNRRYNSKEKRMYYETRVVSTANKMNLELPEALPQLRAELIRSLAGML